MSGPNENKINQEIQSGEMYCDKTIVVSQQLDWADLFLPTFQPITPTNRLHTNFNSYSKIQECQNSLLKNGNSPFHG